MADVFQIVSERMIKALEQNTIPWHKPWCSVNAGAFNRVTGRRYSLMNQMLLSHTGEYASFAQWSKLGGHIRSGEKAELVVFWKWPERLEDRQLQEDPPKVGVSEEGKEKEGGDLSKDRPVLRFYRVFHVSQVENVEPLKVEEASLFATEPIAAGYTLFRDYVRREGIRVVEEMSNQAFYSPADDMIHLPEIRQYQFPEEYHSTAFHEAVHSTGHEKRLGRPGLKRAAFGSEQYSREELVAEIGTAAILHMLGIESDVSQINSEAYVKGWTEAIRGDARMIVSAASAAEKAVKFITAGREA